jgi:hypothetical protein
MSGSNDPPSARAVTHGPKFHWFGYYDKLEFDNSGRYMLGMEVDFEGRSPKPDDTIKVGMVDLKDGNRWIELGESRAWCWQQGCMLQWIPGSGSEVIWNDRESGQFICRILDVKTGKKRTLPMPVYALCSDGHTAITTDFRRINEMRPGYGYAGIPDPNRNVLAPEDTGIWRVDLDTGADKLLLTVAEIASIPYANGDLSEAKHYFNHLLINPGGSRFVFLHRWRFGDGPFRTRMMTANPDGFDIRIVDDSGGTSHFIWRDSSRILMFTDIAPGGRGFYLFDERTGKSEILINDGNNGHCTYLPGNEWILNDTYPLGEKRMQHLYLYHAAAGRKVSLGSYHAAAVYDGEWRCDLHPRFSPDKRMVAIDSSHDGNGRQIYLVDISRNIS